MSGGRETERLRNTLRRQEDKDAVQRIHHQRLVIRFLVALNVVGLVVIAVFAVLAANSVNDAQMAAADSSEALDRADAAIDELRRAQREAVAHEQLVDFRSCRRGQRFSAVLHQSAPVLGGLKLLRQREDLIPIFDCNPIRHGENAVPLSRREQRRFVRYFFGHRTPAGVLGVLPVIRRGHVIFRPAEPTKPPK